MSDVTPAYLNRLLCALSVEDLNTLHPHLVPVELALEQELETPSELIQHVYFIGSGIASTVAGVNKSTGAHPIEIGLVGREGVTGVAVILDNHEALHSIYMQVAGDGHRIEADALRHAMNASRTLQSLLLRYVKVFMMQITETAVANGRSKLEQRLPRWLLMADDRLDEAALPLKHEFLAMMLGVRRAGVTELNELESPGLIKASRGHVNILDRDGLIENANGCYGKPENEYQRLFEN